MKRAILGFIWCTLTSIAVASPKVFLKYYVFYDQNQEPYVETALQFASGSLQFNGDSIGFLQSELEITQIFKQGEIIIAADKYKLLSPLMADSIVDDFFDLKRFKIGPGTYDFELVVTDVKANQTVSGTYNVEVKALNKNRLDLSDVEFIQNLSKSKGTDNFTKNGYQLIPYFSDYFPPVYDKLVYYLEFYNADIIVLQGNTLAATFQIQNARSGEYLEEYFQYKKLKAENIIPVINILPIDKLRSGEYHLVIDVINQLSDTVLHKLVPFKRRSDLPIEVVNVDLVDIDRSFKKELETDSIKYFLGSLMPIAPQHETEKILKMLNAKDTAYMKQYFYSFWKETMPVDPLRGWQDYKMQVYYAEKLFGTQIKRGFESDRGRIHLKYGPPNWVTDQPTGTSAYPYQIWHYYRIGQRSNVRFVFYNPDLVTNDFPLIHSDLPGEVQNQNWQLEIMKRNNSSQDYNDSFRNNSGIYFED